MSVDAVPAFEDGANYEIPDNYHVSGSRPTQDTC